MQSFTITTLDPLSKPVADKPSTDVVTPLVELRGLVHTLVSSGSSHQLEVPELVIPRGSFTAVVGRSGSGKSLLLSDVGLVRQPQAADKYLLHDREGRGAPPTDITRLWRSFRRGRITRLRRQVIGFLPQAGELLPQLTVMENVAVPLRINGWSIVASRQRVQGLLDRLGIPAGLASRRVNRLSGGQYQRVAIARAIAHRPALVLVDEPTAALDLATAVEVIKLIAELNGRRGSCLMVTHNEELALLFADQIIRLGCQQTGPHSTQGFVEEVYRNQPRWSN